VLASAISGDGRGPLGWEGAAAVCLRPVAERCVALQAEIIKDPASYVELDPDVPRTLLDQREAVRWGGRGAHHQLLALHAAGSAAGRGSLPSNRTFPDGVAGLQGKVLMLITNSDFQYTDTMMSYAYDRYLPDGMTWRDLFDMVRCLCLGGCSMHAVKPRAFCSSLFQDCGQSVLLQ
jgi:5' nucleotidase family